MNDMKNTMLNAFIGGGIGVEILNITIVDVGDALRIVALSCAIIGFLWKWKRQGMFKKDK